MCKNVCVCIYILPKCLACHIRFGSKTDEPEALRRVEYPRPPTQFLEAQEFWKLLLVPWPLPSSLQPAWQTY